MLKRLFIFLFFLQSRAVFSQDTLRGYFRFTYDNDLFTGTDRYYTQGIRLDLVHPFVEHSPLSHALPRLKDARNAYGIRLEQDVFTPRSIRYSNGAVYEGERPYSAVFFVSHLLTSTHPLKQLALSSQLDLGFMGPAALGEQEQKAIHRATNNAQPLGWEHQLAGDAVVNYKCGVEKGLVSARYFELIGNAAARLGTLYTDAGLGLQLRAGLLTPYFIEEMRNNKFRLYLYAKANARAIGYNATLQGGLFNRSSEYTLPSSAVNRFVADASAGLVLGFGRMRLEYAQFYITPEFKSGLDHGWGRCSILVLF